MFKELAQIVNKGTSFHILISGASDGELRVTVMPQGQNAAINTPLALTASPEELDEKFSSVLSEYTGTRTSVEEALENAKTVMEAAGKTAVEAAANAGKKAVKPTNADETSDLEEDGEYEVMSASTAKRDSDIAEMELF